MFALFTWAVADVLLTRKTSTSAQLIAASHRTVSSIRTDNFIIESQRGWEALRRTRILIRYSKHVNGRKVGAIWNRFRDISVMLRSLGPGFTALALVLLDRSAIRNSLLCNLYCYDWHLAPESEATAVEPKEEDDQKNRPRRSKLLDGSMGGSIA